MALAISKIKLPSATELTPGFFIGTREDAEALGARVPDDWACISVTEYRSRYKRKEELPNEPDGSLDLPFMTDRPDGWHADRHKLDLIAETIWTRLLLGKRVLVHCIHAQERAPLVGAWYLAWSGEVPSLAGAYDVVMRRHPRTERRDKWLRDAVPRRRPELAGLLSAARNIGSAMLARMQEPGFAEAMKRVFNSPPFVEPVEPVESIGPTFKETP
jgi:hypothetical protein